MQGILEYLNHELGADGNKPVAALLERLLNGSREEKLLLCCIGIDIKYKLLQPVDYAKLLTDFLSADPPLDEELLQRFHHFLMGLPEKNLFSNACLEEGHQKYVRAVTDTTFIRHIADPAISEPMVENGGYNIDTERFRTGEKTWGTRKEIVWITLWELFQQMLQPGDPRNASRVCDFLGWPRTPDMAKGQSARAGRKFKLLAVVYPNEFPSTAYQPNATNAQWHEPGILYVSHKNETSEHFGLTYNDFNVPFGKERIHKKLSYWHEDFQVQVIGEPEIESPANDGILDEAIKRFYNA